MCPSLFLSAALIAPAAPVPNEATPSTPGPAPRVLALKADAGGNVRVVGNIPTKVTVTNTHITVDANGNQVQKQVDQDIVTTQHFDRTLADFNGQFATAGGTPLTLAEATARLKKGATLLASSDGKPVALAWLRAVDPGTVVMVAEGLGNVQPQWGGGTLPETPDPRLTMLGADDSGKVVAPCTSSPVNANGGIYYGNDVMFEQQAMGGGRLIRGGGFASNYGYPTQQTDAKVVLKPLADVKFDAYDVTGKLVPRAEAMKRLAAGGMVLVAGDNRLPDADYLKVFQKDVLVLIAPELVLPIPPVDQTKKKGEAKGAKGPNANPLLPAVRPAIIINRRAGNVILPAAPAVEKK